ncbi:MAG TPA: sensor histidine kinase [Solirubrobacteraceae bacterium]|jgi:anti-sigma regulatory factor (Ser/Thr protein kinase)|nr:sensor histidine kinase [Solirubrobacteraceae bacterium]
MPPNPEARGCSSSADARASARDGAFRHELLLYERGDHGFVEGTLAPVRDALEHGAAVLVAVEQARATALIEALGADGARACFADVRSLSGNPARLMPAWREFSLEHASAGAGCALAIAEQVWPGRTAAELSECERHEQLVNLAFAEDPAWRMLCTYDVDGLDDHVLDAAKANHPLIAAAGVSLPNDGCTCAAGPPRPFAGSLPAPQPMQAGAVTKLSFTGTELASVRHAVSTWARSQRLSVPAVDDLVLAVDELAANSIRHGGGAGVLSFWREPHALVCEVRDSGMIEEALVGRQRPSVDASSGRGVWLVNQLCDLVQIRSGPGGTVVRVNKRLSTSDS